VSPCPSLNLSGLYWVLKSTENEYINVTYDISLANFRTRFVCGEYKISEIEKNLRILRDFEKNFKEKSKPLGLGSDVCCFYPISFNTSILFVLKNRTSKNGTPETLDHPLKLKYFEFKNFGENGINFLMDILWILKDFGYHNVTWKRRFNSEISEIFGFLKWCNDDWLEESYEVNLRSDYR